MLVKYFWDLTPYYEIIQKSDTDIEDLLGFSLSETKKETEDSDNVQSDDENMEIIEGLPGDDPIDMSDIDDDPGSDTDNDIPDNGESDLEDDSNISDDMEDENDFEDELESDEETDVIPETSPVKTIPTGKYIPPALRAETNALDRMVRGHLNKLSSSNIYAISHEFVSIYRTNARKLVSASVLTTISNQVVQPTSTPLLLVEDYSCFLIILHQLISTEISTYIIEELISKYLQLDATQESDKKISNLLSLICCLTRLQLFKTKLVVEILEKLIDRFSVDDVNHIQLILNSVAFTIRKEDPAALKSIILAVHQKVRDGGVALESQGGSRIKFVLETLTNVKNNNLNATKSNPGFVDKDRDDACKKRIRSVIGQIQLEPMPAIGISDILKIAELGRWWQVGAAVVVQREKTGTTELRPEAEPVSEKLKSAAKKLRLNTDNKRNIFYLLNTCEDFIDAANKIIALRLKGSNRQVKIKNFTTNFR